VAFVCARCALPAYAGEYEALFAEILPEGLVCGGCLYAEEGA